MTIVTLASCQIVHIHLEANSTTHDFAKTIVKQLINEIRSEEIASYISDALLEQFALLS